VQNDFALTARSAADREYPVFIAGNCVAALDSEPELHNASLVNMTCYVGTVMPNTAIAVPWPRSSTRQAAAYGRITS
jgi:nicotinamidase-related amidase